MKIDRLLSIIIVLLNRDKISASELADKFEVSVRTIYRDIDDINMAGIPIVSQAGSNGGFGILDNYKISHQLLTLDDMISIVEALKSIKSIFDDKNVETAIEKVKSIVPQDKKQLFDLHFEQIVIDNSPWGFKRSDKENEKYNIIYESITNKKILAFNYRNSKNEYSLRKVEPLTLVFKIFSWYLFSYCRLRSDYRIFKLSRMNSLYITDEQFEDDRMSFKQYMDVNSYNKKPEKIILKFSEKVRYRVEDYFSEDELKVEKDGSIIAETHFIVDDWAYSMLLSYGDYVEVIEPEHIREIMRSKAQRIMNLYQNMT